MARLPGELALDHQVLRSQGDRWVLVVSRCPACGDVRYPPRELCPLCLASCEDVEASEEGEVYAAVRVQIAPVGFEPPYWVAYVDLPERVRVFAPLDWSLEDPPERGRRVRYRVEVVRTDPEQVLGPVFEPIED